MQHYPPSRPSRTSTHHTEQTQLAPGGLRKVTLTSFSGEPRAPRALRTIARPQESARANAASPASRLIVVIDDSPTVCKIVEITLQREGYQTISFPNGNSALGWLLNPTTVPPGLILLDLSLPDTDGYTILRQLKASSHFTNTVRIIISRRDGVADKLKSRLAGAQAYITKPFTQQTLLDAVQPYLPAEQDTHP